MDTRGLLARSLRYNLGVRPAPVKAAGPFQVLILVTSDSWFDRNGLEGRSHVRTAYEHSCEDPHVCAEVSTALYLRESAASDQSLIVRALEAGFGWENALGREYPLGHPESEQATTKTD